MKEKSRSFYKERKDMNYFMSTKVQNLYLEESLMLWSFSKITVEGSFLGCMFFPATGSWLVYCLRYKSFL